MVAQDAPSLYVVLGVKPNATEKEIRRAYKNLATKEHPDKGGSQEKFQLLQKAYQVLSNTETRHRYDTTGTFEKTVDEEFLNSFGGGSFRDTGKDVGTRMEEQRNMAEALVARQADLTSHTAGFEAFMRARGGGQGMLFTADNVIDMYGVTKTSYDAVPLPQQKTHVVTCVKAGGTDEVAQSVSLSAEPLPTHLEWGEVLVALRAAPVNPADLYSIATGGAYGLDSRPVPFVAGMDGVAVVKAVGPGVKNLAEGDWVIPGKAFLGTWRTLAVWKEKEVVKVEREQMPLEYFAMARELCTAYRLLEDQSHLRPGDAVILNAANSTVGQTLVQLCKLLRLRSVAVVRAADDETFKETEMWLKNLGADEVLPDQGSLSRELETRRFFARPKVAFDSVGGHSAMRIADALAEGGTIMIYGCSSGKAPTWTWQQWVFKRLKAEGFNIRRWMTENVSKVPGMLESIAKLVKASKLTVNFTEYQMPGEFTEALEHAAEPRKNTKVILRAAEEVESVV